MLFFSNIQQKKRKNKKLKKNQISIYLYFIQYIRANFSFILLVFIYLNVFDSN
jgi:hypothetical protein